MSTVVVHDREARGVNSFPYHVFMAENILQTPVPTENISKPVIKDYKQLSILYTGYVLWSKMEKNQQQSITMKS